MTNETIMFDNELIDQFSSENNDLAIDTGDQDEHINDAGAPINNENDGFELYDYNDFGNSSNAEKDETKRYNSKHANSPDGQKHKRVRPESFSSTTHTPERSAKRTQVLDADTFIIEEDNSLLNTPKLPEPGTFGRRERGEGSSLPAYHKKISSTLDSDDELMMQMRAKGFSDRQIADKLAKDGRVRYDTKSISTRIMRIRLAQASNVDFLLKEGYKEWEFNDDCLLMQAYALADIEVSYEIERIRTWRFRKVSEYMRRLNKDALFSETACRERYNALLKGTARIPTNMDDDPAARRAEMDAYRTWRETLRAKEALEKATQAAAERKAKEEAREKSAQKAQETASRRAVEETEKAQRALQRAAKAQLRAQRAAENQQAKAQRNAQIKKQKFDLKGEEKKKDKDKDKDKTGKTPHNPFSKPIPPSEPSSISPLSTVDPRSSLSLQDLSTLCAHRGINTVGKSHAQLLHAAQGVDEEWTAADLRKMCKSKGLSSQGNKVELRYRLAVAAARGFASWVEGK